MNRLEDQILQVVSELYNQELTKEGNLNGIITYYVKHGDDFLNPIWIQETNVKVKAAFEDYRALKVQVEQQRELEIASKLADLKQKINEYDYKIIEIENKIDELEYNLAEENLQEQEIEKYKDVLLNQEEEYNKQIENIQTQIYEIRNIKLENINTELTKKLEIAEELYQQRYNNLEAHEKLQVYTQAELYRIKNALQPNQLLGLVLIGNKHVEGLIFSENKIVRITPGSGSLPSVIKDTIPKLKIPYFTLQHEITTETVDPKSTKPVSLTRTLQADDYNCATFVLKMLKTLLSKNPEGKSLFDTLKINPENPLELLLPSDIAKMSQSQFLVDQLLTNNSELTVGKHQGKTLDDFRKPYQTKEGNQYIKTVYTKYQQLASNPEILIKKLEKVNPNLAQKLNALSADQDKIAAFLAHPSVQRQQVENALATEKIILPNQKTRTDEDRYNKNTPNNTKKL